ncbi:MAG: hypothetical protein PHD43_14610 [Methylococcales bacterium]|nr:hypothetical protein [Methylococcales bacterium]
MIVKTVNSNQAKPFPAGEGWVKGNENKEKSLFEFPHPSLIMPDYPVRHPAVECKSAPGRFVPGGEGAYTLESKVLNVMEEVNNG